MTSLKDLSDTIVTKVSSGANPLEATIAELKDRGLGAEKISRICVMVNRELLEKDKDKGFTKNSGRIWEHQSWETVKPEDVCASLKISMPQVAQFEKQSYSQGAVKSSAQKRSSVLSSILQDNTPLAPTQDPNFTQPVKKISSTPVEDPTHVLHGILNASRTALKESSVKLSEARMYHTTCRDALSRHVKESFAGGLNLGERLFVLKHFGLAQDDFEHIAKDALESANIKESDLGGATLLPDGNLDTNRIEFARKQTKVSSEIQSAVRDGRLDPNHELIKLSRQCVEARRTYQIYKDTNALLQEEYQDRHQRYMDVVKIVRGGASRD